MGWVGIFNREKRDLVDFTKLLRYSDVPPPPYFYTLREALIMQAPNLTGRGGGRGL